MNTKSKTYTCAACGGTFEEAWTDEEAAVEYQEVFGHLATSSMAVVCDDCYNAMVKAYPPTQFAADVKAAQSCQKPLFPVHFCAKNHL